MAATRSQSKRKPNLGQRFINFWRDLFASGDFSALIIVTSLLVVPTLGLRAADWPLTMSVIIPVTIMSVFFGLLLSRSQFNELMALIISTTYGVCIVLMVTAIGIGGGLTGGVYEVFSRTVEWVIDANTGGINQDDMVFTLLVATLFWFLGYNAAWHTFRIDRIWRVILPPGLILATNSTFYTGDANLEIYFAVFIFMALLLVARSNLDSREWDWQRKGIQVPQQLRAQFLRVGAMLALVALLLGWGVPSGNLQQRLDNFQEFLQSEPLTQMSEFWNRLFSPIDAQGPVTADYYGGDSLDLGGAIRLGDQTVFLVDTPPDRRYYWRSRTFATYNRGRWTSTPPADIRLTDSTAPFDVIRPQYNAREEVQQRFTMALNGSRLVYTAPQPELVSLEVHADLSYTAPEDDPSRTMNISVIRPQEVIRRGESYTASSSMSVATAPQLRTATQAYSAWLAPYLVVSDSVTPRTQQLARTIIAEAGAVNPYDQAKAIEFYLRTNILYNESIPRPPSNQDPVDWVLFDYQEGYCNYYASAMIVMLRSIGIPARMAAGFAQGQYDTVGGNYIITEREAHTWVEAYFPDYGWIEFEPTAAQTPIQREGDDQNLQAPPPVDQAQQATPTVTPTPTMTLTLQPTTTPPTDESQSDVDVPTPTPTITPTPSPTPTATPVIVPTQPPPMSPPDAQNPIEVILPAIGLLLLGLLLIALLVALVTFIYWWWEWRGMGGLSPISRAYARLDRYIKLIGIRLGNDQTTEERRREIVRNIPQAERPVTAITRMYTTERYGPGAPHPAEAQRKSDIAAKAWTQTRKNIIRRWLRRLRFWSRR